MKNPPLAIALAALIFIATFGGNDANAYALSNFIKQAEVIKVTAFNSATSTAINVTTIIKGFASNDPYFVKTIDIPKSNITGFIKNNAKTLKNLAGWTVAFSALGWTLDEAGNLFKQEGVTPADNVVGTCSMLNNFTTPGMTFSSCLAKISTYGNPPGIYSISGSWTRYDAWMYYRAPGKGTYNGQTWSETFQFQPSPWNGHATQNKKTPVTDDQIYDGFSQYATSHPEEVPKLFTHPADFPYIDLFPVAPEYIPGVAQSDEEALDLYFKGLLQSTNPGAAHYVTPERYQQIAALASQLQQGLTPESQTGELNDQLKKPLTQKELEESLKKEREAEDKATKEALGTAPALDTLLDPYNQFEQKVKDTPQDEINELPDNNYSISGQGRCYVIEKPISIMGTTITLSTREFCDAYYYPYFLPILTWFFYVATGIYVWFSLRDAYSRRV